MMRIKSIAAGSAILLTGDGFANNSWHVIKPEAARSGY